MGLATTFSSPSPFSLLLAGGALERETRAPPAKRSEKEDRDENVATIDPHSQKEHTEIYKIPKLGVNQANFD